MVKADSLGQKPGDSGRSPNGRHAHNKLIWWNDFLPLVVLQANCQAVAKMLRTHCAPVSNTITSAICCSGTKIKVFRQRVILISLVATPLSIKNFGLHPGLLACTHTSLPTRFKQPCRSRQQTSQLCLQATEQGRQDTSRHTYVCITWGIRT